MVGPITRINPNEVHLGDPEMLDVISPGTGRRTNKPEAVGKRTGIPNSMVATVDHGMHQRRRNSVNAFFSTAFIRRLGLTTQKHMESMLIKIAEYGRSGSSVQLVR
ncbi:putative cytochrome p450 [Rosellinia necatrix]|uniref:Putative cytochrome p450 n=1 Tax=Rosellinia necatrix TaxID=77044 RepID=A0A1S8A9L3_ROSNE|nr:putative cytochrome p450 [Rosellinia necatrix]